MKVQVIRSNRKTIGLEVRADESVILRAPQWLSEKELDEWIGEHAYWIEEKVKQMRQRNLNKKLTGAPAVDEILDVEWKSILGEFTERVNYFCKIMEVTVGRITIRNQRIR
jgi:predicted metal-dependent hydrolase